MQNSNYLYKPDDTLIIQLRSNNRGRYIITQSVINFSDAITTADVLVHVYFRIVENGVIAGDWTYIGVADSENNEFNVNFEVPRESVLQVKFIRKGIETEDGVKFVSMNIGSTFIVDKKPTPTIDASMFSAINSQPETKTLEDNFFKKLYFRGIVPNYIKRGANLSKTEDEDYITLFSTIARFFAIIIRFFKRWENISNDEEILKEILRNNGIQFDETKITLPELQEMTQNLYNEISKRGTKEILMKVDDIRPDGSVVSEDGEFIRLIRANKSTEILYETVPRYELGWCLGKSSPMYRGIPNDCLHLDKMNYSNKTTHKFATLADFNKILKFGNISIAYDPTIAGVGSVASISGSVESGFGRNSESTDAANYLINVDACMDYEIMFAFKVTNASGGAITASIEGFTGDKIKLPDAFIMPNKTTITGSFFYEENSHSVPLTKFITNKWYYVRLIIKAYSSESQSSYKLNIGMGNELHFNNAFVKYILPTIKITGGKIRVCNYHIRPLVRGTNINRITNEGFENCFSLGFLRLNKLFHMYLRNKNTTLSKEDVEDFMNHYLLPYNSTNILTFIE